MNRSRFNMADLIEYTGSNATEIHDEIVLALIRGKDSIGDLLKTTINLLPVDIDSLFTEKTSVEVEMEKPIFKGGNYRSIGGYIDLLFYVGEPPEISRFPYFAVEVKSRIKSVTETVRQVKTHLASMPTGFAYYVASPDNRYKEVFEYQGIGFLDLSGMFNNG